MSSLQCWFVPLGAIDPRQQKIEDVPVSFHLLEILRIQSLSFVRGTTLVAIADKLMDAWDNESYAHCYWSSDSEESESDMSTDESDDDLPTPTFSGKKEDPFVRLSRRRRKESFQAMLINSAKRQERREKTITVGNDVVCVLKGNERDPIPADRYLYEQLAQFRTVAQRNANNIFYVDDRQTI